MSHELDQPERIGEIQEVIARKPALKNLYLEAYAKYRACLAQCPRDGIALELGSGGGFAKQLIPELVTSDVIPYPGVDRVVDALAMPFKDRSLRAIVMLNTFHHIPDAEKFLSEAQRCLMPGGRLLILDQHVGWISRWILKYAHHEPFDSKTLEWKFATTGPLSGANGALAWMVFKRDHARLAQRFPGLNLLRYKTHTPLRYWMSGGLKAWSLIPARLFGFATAVDRGLARAVPELGSFVDIEVVKHDL